jgi:hypothetical protein
VAAGRFGDIGQRVGAVMQAGVVLSGAYARSRVPLDPLPEFELPPESLLRRTRGNLV